MKTFKQYIEENRVPGFNHSEEELNDIYSKRINSLKLMRIFDISLYVVNLRRNGLTPKIVCNDGFRMSVQASDGHYCSPRNNAGPYLELEVGYPSRNEPLLKDYMETPYDNPTETVYPYVPKDTIEKIINKHGGISWDDIVPVTMKGKF
jgi:hypothetical protein